MKYFHIVGRLIILPAKTIIEWLNIRWTTFYQRATYMYINIPNIFVELKINPVKDKFNEILSIQKEDVSYVIT